MRVRCVDGRFLIRLEPGEEAMASLRSWAAEQKVGFAVLWAIGAMRRATLGYFDTPPPSTGKFRWRSRWKS